MTIWNNGRFGNVRKSIGGGPHVSTQSDGTSFRLLPQQFSYCLRAHDDAVQHVRADLIITGMAFSGGSTPDISFDDGMLSSQALTENLLANSGRIGLHSCHRGGDYSACAMIKKRLRSVVGTKRAALHAILGT